MKLFLHLRRPIVVIAKPSLLFSTWLHGGLLALYHADLRGDGGAARVWRLQTRPQHTRLP
jgi:hypothetical protein